ncbi:MAG: HAD family hydrolase [Parcubacteria group bacterium]|jgi:putative hydrolase of the HAD superfamily
MIKALFIDLDNCLFDTQSMGLDIVRPVLAAMMDADPYEILELERRERIIAALWTSSLQDVIESHGIPEDIADAMRVAYANLEAPLWSKCYDDVGLLRETNLRKILVTSGHSKLQLSKIRVTGIQGLFEEIVIDAIDDPLARPGKLNIFRELMAKNGWQAHEVAVLGDNPRSELKAGKELGMLTIQVLRPGVKCVEGFDYYVVDLKEVLRILG